MTAGRVAKSRKKVRPSAQPVVPTMRRGAGQRGRDMRDTVNGLFDNFKDADEDKIGPESLEAFFEALELDPLDISALIFAWKLNAQTPCEFSRAEFVDGLMRLGVDSMAKLKKKVHTLKSMIVDPSDFRSFYIFSFDYNKPPGQRTMPIETARQLWPLLFGDRFEHLDLWLEFLEPRRHAITRDSFVLLLDFANTIRPDLSNYDEECGAWPVIIDEFVDFAKSRQPAPEAASEDDHDMSD
jgi:DCN1-like protein 1/2